MKTMAFKQAFIIFFSAIEIAASADCKNVSTLNTDCCKFPDIKGPEIDKIAEKVMKILTEKANDANLAECKVAEDVFKEFKLAKGTEIDADGIGKFFDKIVADDNWKPVFQAAVKTCKTKTDEKSADLVKKMEATPFNIKKNQCNVKFESFTLCLMFEFYSNCPKSQWTENSQCAATKSWVKDCAKNYDTFKEVL